MSTVTKKDSKEDIVSSFRQATFGEAIDSRNRAIELIDTKGLPGSKHEEYRFAPITRNLESLFTWKNEISPSNITSTTEFEIPNMDSNVLVFVNGSYSTKLSRIISPSSEIKIKTLFDAFKDGEKSVTKYFDKLVSAEADSFAALNTAFWQEGLFLEVPANTTVQKPVMILHINDARQAQVIAHTRLLAMLEEGSTVSIIEKFDSQGTNPVFHTFTEEIVVKEKATLEYCKVQNDAGKSFQIANTNINQSDSSHVNTFTLTLNGEIVRNNFGITIDGENCESHFYGLYLLNGSTLADNHTVVDHRKPNSFSNEMYKGVMDENSKGVFNGKIFVRPHAQKTNAFQSNRNILLSDTASVNTKPQLEIWADDVKCSHGCTSGQLDEEALFYLRSRGIDAQMAKAMLLYAFSAEVLQPIKNETLKAYLDTLIAERLRKDF